MATKTAKNRKPITSRTKGFVCLVLLLAVTVFVSWLGITGMDLDAQGVNVLLPWIPVSSENWPASLPMSRALGGGTYTEYHYTIPEGAAATALDDSIKTIRARLDAYGETDGDVSANDDHIRLELRNTTASRRSNVLSLVTMPGQFEFSDAGTVYLTEKDIAGTNIAASYAGGQLAGYTLTLKIRPESRASLDAAGVTTLTATMDGESLGVGALTNDGLVLNFTTSTYNTLSTVDYIIRTGAVDVDMVREDSGDVGAPLSIVLKVVLWVCAALLCLTLIYTLISGKLTGISATLSVWCAVVLALFLVATVVVPTIVSLSVGCLVAILLGILIAMFTAVTRTDAISKQIGEGSTPKAATKVGFKMSAKTVWIVHGAAAVLSLILMIFTFSRPTGYCLLAGVLASAIAVVIMRAFQACFTAMSSKAALFGKVK